jgi:hypothetical protein
VTKAILVVWFGPWPAWGEAYFKQVPSPGFDRIVFDDLDEFRRRVKRELGIACPIEPGSAKIHDYRPLFGRLFKKELAGYDWWAHTDLDVVYGRLDRFYSDLRISRFDVVSDHDHYLCGPWTIYRNTPAIRDLWAAHPDAREILMTPAVAGWVETGFTELVNESGLRVEYLQRHAYENPDQLRWLGRRLVRQVGVDRGERDLREISFFHFRRQKVWPDIPVLLP